jgi:hypothetical protein
VAVTVDVAAGVIHVVRDEREVEDADRAVVVEIGVVHGGISCEGRGTGDSREEQRRGHGE